MPSTREYGAPPQVDATGPDDYLEEMTRAVFQTGLSWDVVNNKWPGIREAMDGFDTEAIADWDEAHIEALMGDRRVIRNRRKLEAISTNAQRILELEGKHGSFKAYLEAQGGFEPTVKALKRDFKFLGETGSYVFLYVVKQPVPPHDEWEASRKPK